MPELTAVQEQIAQAGEKDERVQAFWDNEADWSRSVFGPDHIRGPIGPLKHLEKEACEAQAAPDDLEEKADCLFLIFDATRRSGKTLTELLDACERKLEINRARKWSKPTADGEPIEHVRTGAAGEASDGE